MIFLSIIIPAFNEEKRIPNTLLNLLNYLSAKSYKWEIILVDDGSTDRTSEIAKEIIKNNSLTVIKNHLNQGKGYSVKRGVLSSKGKVLFFSDADLSASIEDLDKMLLWIDRGYDIVIGSRMLPESIIEVRQPLHRELMGKIFNLLVQSFVLKGFKDTQCGFKCFKRESALQVFSLQRLAGFAFDVEILYIAQKCGFKIKEQPVRWTNSPASKVHLLKGSLSMILELLKIRLYNWKGYYRF